MILNEPNIELFLNTSAINVIVKDNVIKSVVAYNTKSETEFEFISSQYADCSGDGIVGYKAGASFMMGSESKSQFGEKWATENEELYTMGNSLYWEIEDTGRPVSYVAPSFAKDITKLKNFDELQDKLKFRNLSVNGVFWTLEYGGQKNTIKDSEEIAFELRSLAYGIWDYIKNSGQFPEAKNYIMKKVQTIPGTREGRRFYGEYVLTENDIEHKTYFKDAVAIGGWPMDVHDWQGFYGSNPASNFIPVSSIYNIPFRCLYSKDIKNLLFAGRNISATHIAFGSTRVMATCASLGQAVGTAVSLCKKYDVNPAEIYLNHVEELQKELVYDDQTIVGVKEMPYNLINKSFKVSTSGTSKYENTEQDIVRTCDHNYALALTIDNEKLEGISIKFKNNSLDKQIIEYEVLTGSRPEAFLPDAVQKRDIIELAPDFYGYVNLNINVKAGKDKKIYLVFRKNKNISICCSNTRIPGAVTFRYYDSTHSMGEYWNKDSLGFNHDSIPFDGVNKEVYSKGIISFVRDNLFEGEDICYLAFDQVSHQICFKDISPNQNVYSEANLLNEYSRPYGSLNMWISDTVGARIMLESNGLQKVREIQLIFNTNLETDVLKRMPGQLVKDYDITFITEYGEKVINIRNNIQRMNKIKVDLENVSKLKIEILKTYGASKVHLYGIRVFGDASE